MKKVTIQGCLGPGSGENGEKVRKVTELLRARENNRNPSSGPGCPSLLDSRFPELVSRARAVTLLRIPYARAKKRRN